MFYKRDLFNGKRIFKKEKFNKNIYISKKNLLNYLSRSTNDLQFVVEKNIQELKNC